jgi:hypothetical protein
MMGAQRRVDVVISCPRAKYHSSERVGKGHFAVLVKILSKQALVVGSLPVEHDEEYVE